MIRALLKDSMIYGAATVVSRGLAILTVPVYTRILSPAEYGVLDLVATLGVLVMIVVPLEVGQGLARLWADERDAAGRRQLAGTAFWFSALAYLGFLLLSLVFSPSIAGMLRLSVHHQSALQLGLVVSSGTGLFFALQNQFRWELRSMEYAWTSLLYAVLLVGIGVFLGVVAGMGLVGVLTGQLLAALVCGVVSFVLLRPSLAFAIDPGRLRSLLAFSWPLVFSGVATFLSLYANRLILNALTSQDAVGLFAVGQRVASIGGLTIVGVQAALTPLIYSHYMESGTPATLSRIFSGFFAVALLSCLGLSLFAPELVRIFAPPAYGEAAGLVALLAPAVLLSQMYVFAPGIAIGKKTFWQFAVFLVSAGSCIGLSFLLIPHLGAEGAAWSALASSVVFFALWVAVSQHWYPLPFRWGGIFAAGAGFVLCVLAGGLVRDFSFWPGLLARAGLIALLAFLVLALGLVDRHKLAAVLTRKLRVAG